MERETTINGARPKLGELVDDAALDGTITYLTRRGRRFAAIVPLDRIAPEEPMTEQTAPTLPYVHETTTGTRGDPWETPDAPERPDTDGLWIDVTERAGRGDTLMQIYRGGDETPVADYTHPARLLPGDAELDDLVHWLSGVMPAIEAARPELARAARVLADARTDADLADGSEDDAAIDRAARRHDAAYEEWEEARRAWWPRVRAAFGQAGEDGYARWCEAIADNGKAAIAHL